MSSLFPPIAPLDGDFSGVEKREQLWGMGGKKAERREGLKKDCDCMCVSGSFNVKSIDPVVKRSSFIQFFRDMLTQKKRRNRFFLCAKFLFLFSAILECISATKKTVFLPQDQGWIISFLIKVLVPHPCFFTPPSFSNFPNPYEVQVGTESH